MSQTFFSKQDVPEKNNRLGQLGNSKTSITIWIKGKKEKHHLPAAMYDKERLELIVDSQEEIFPNGTEILCTFQIRGMTFFSQVIFRKSAGNNSILHFKNDLFKSERRTSYRLLTYPLYNVWADFDLGVKYEGSNVLDMNARAPRTRQTKLFQNFLKLADEQAAEPENLSRIKIRVQDISATGMSIHISDLEAMYFMKDMTYTKVFINFVDEILEIPNVKIVYVVDYISNDKNIKRYKIGCNFTNLGVTVDDLLSKKINKLLRENDFNKDFETFVK
ncbi:MAG TPA: hypothetical protein VNJ08_05315 [Bacteriovoracaceae bacterium]|nr:hypothetical protein [Bacteriovoracaceae bacterium]